MKFTTAKRVKGNKFTVTVFADGKPIGTRTSDRDFRFAVVVARADGSVYVASWHQSRKSISPCEGLVAVVEFGPKDF